MKCFDLKINGAFGVDFSDPELTAEQIRKAVDGILRAGVTRFLPTIMTSSMALYRRNLPLILRTVETAGLNYEIPGLHLEGPFISPEPDAVGMHDPSFVTEPTPEKMMELYRIAEGKIRLMTFAAERPGAAETIQTARECGITPSLGHQLADAAQIEAAHADAFTHLGNGIPDMIHRDKNPIWAGLANDSLSALIITDGYHLTPDLIKCFIRCKGVERILLISDAASVAGLPPGKYHTRGKDTVLEPDGLFYDYEKQCLAGSGSLTPRCFDYLESLNLLTEDEMNMAAWDNPHKLLKLTM